MTVEWACRTLNRWGFHVRDQGDKLLCFHTRKAFDAQICVDGDVPDSVRIDQIISAIKMNKIGQIKPAEGGLRSGPEFAKPITVKE